MKRASVFVLSGWLFADLMLVLVLIGVLTQARQEKSISEVLPAMLTPTVAQAAPAGLDPTRIVRRVSVSERALLNGDASAAQEVRQQVAEIVSGDELRGRYAGIVFTFGRSTVDSPNRGVELATKVNALLKEDRLFQVAVSEDFLSFNQPPDTVDIWIYLLAGGR
jgi:hypothetical protein